MTLPALGNPRLSPHLERLQAVGEAVEAEHRGLRIRSAFQPVFSFAHNRAVGFEALARARKADGAPVPVSELLSMDRSVEGTVFLDRLLRALHAANFSTRPEDSTWLFLNVAPTVVVNGRSQGPYFKDLLEAFHLPPHRIVVEVTENETPDERLLQEAAHYYKDLGCLVAIDDFGAGHSNFHRIWRLRPDLIKLDRLMVAEAARDPVARRSLSGITGLLHETGALVLAEGVETEAEALVAVQAEIDLLQGYYFQKPEIGFSSTADALARMESLRGALSRECGDHEAEFQESLKPYLEAFEEAARRIGEGCPPEAAFEALLRLRSVVRGFVLDASGAQSGPNITAPSCAALRDVRHQPLADARGANWMHRHYFRRALARPDRTQIGRPYLSLTDPGLCLTLSRAVLLGGRLAVVCCDLEVP